MPALGRSFAAISRDIHQAQLDKITANTEHPCTWLISDTQNKLPAEVRGEHTKVAVRLETHAAVRDITKALGRPITSTSANLSEGKVAGNARKM